MSREKVKTAKGIPAQCYGVVKSENEIVIFKAGETGFYKVDQARFNHQAGHSEISMNEVANKENDKLGVTKGQRVAMEFGSYFGWDSVLADPSIYDQAGSLKV